MLIKCPECGREISDKAQSCPNCGCPASEFFIEEREIIISESSKKATLRLVGNTLILYDKKGNVKISDYLSNYTLINYYKLKHGATLTFTHNTFDGAATWSFKEIDIVKSDELCEIMKKESIVDWKSPFSATFYKTKEQKENKILSKQQEKEEMQENLQKISAMGNMLSGRNKTVHCPKCGSTSISYGAKPSIGRAAVGYGLAGTSGGVIGGLTGKKGCAVCLNCGKQWKI